MDDSLASESVFPSSGEVAVPPDRRVATIGPAGRPLQERQNQPYAAPGSLQETPQSLGAQRKDRMDEHSNEVSSRPVWRFGRYSKFRGRVLFFA
jgi:hypothetical protein